VTRTSSGSIRANAVTPLVLDLVVVFVFAAVGRDEHQQTNTIGDIVTVAAPFVIGALVGAALAWPRGRDLGTISSGLIVLLTTLVVGMLLRRFVWDRGTAATFVLVTTGFLTAGFMGWRALRRIIRR